MVLHTTRHKIGHFGNVSPSQPLGLVWKKLKTNESTHSPIKRNVLQHKKHRHPVRKRSRSILKGGHWWFNRQPCRSISDADLNEHVDGGRRGDIECADATALDVVGLERDARVVVADVAKHEAAALVARHRHARDPLLTTRTCAPAPLCTQVLSTILCSQA